MLSGYKLDQEKLLSQHIQTYASTNNRRQNASV